MLRPYRSPQSGCALPSPQPAALRPKPTPGVRSTVIQKLRSTVIQKYRIFPRSRAHRTNAVRWLAQAGEWKPRSRFVSPRKWAPPQARRRQGIRGLAGIAQQARSPTESSFELCGGPDVAHIALAHVAGRGWFVSFSNSLRTSAHGGYHPSSRAMKPTQPKPAKMPTPRGLVPLNSTSTGQNRSE